jgi:hypothetical protein
MSVVAIASTQIYMALPLITLWKGEAGRCLCVAN